MLLDGAMGTELIRCGVPLPLPLWSAEANITHPETVLNIHRDYIASGADIITTNTFRTTSYTYRKAGFSAKRAKERARGSLFSAIDIARKAVESEMILGSITAVEDCYTPQLFPGKIFAEDIYGELVEWFITAGMKNLIFETMGNLEEIQIAQKTCAGEKLTVWISLILKDSERILDGTALTDVIVMLKETDIECLLLNCNQIQSTNSALPEFLSLWKKSWGIYPNLGLTDFNNDYFEIITDGEFKKNFEKYLELNPDVVGACCGSTPKHIKMLREMMDKRKV